MDLQEYKTSTATWIATGLGIGYIPYAPGTWGSIPGLALGAYLHFTAPALCSYLGLEDVFVPVMLTAFLAISVWIALIAIHKTEVLWSTHDDKRIVIDEVVGQAIAVAYFTPEPLFLMFSFIVFRILDIRKPSVIGWADQNLPGAWGTLIDDVIAGVATAAVTGFGLYFWT